MSDQLDRSDHSVTMMLNNLRQGEEVSKAQKLIWERFFHRLKALADKKMAPEMRRVVDGEDIAISAFYDFFKQMASDDEAFPQLTDRQSLWPLLAKITSRKTINEFKKTTAQKRGGGMVRGESVFVKADQIDAARGIEQIDRTMTPEFADEMFLGFDDILGKLRSADPKLYEIAIMKLKGYTPTEIAEKLGYKTVKSIERNIKHIRILWKGFHGGLATLSIWKDGVCQFETNINEEPIIVGRQRAGEDDPYWSGVSEINGKATRRVVVAGIKENAISRNHANIHIEDEDNIHVTNASRKSKIMPEPALLLSPGESWSTNASCELKLSESITVRIDLC